MRVLWAALRLCRGSRILFRAPLGWSKASLSPTLFGIYIDELEDFLWDFSLLDDGCYLHWVLISLMIFTISQQCGSLGSSPKGLQRLLVGLASFCDSWRLVVNLGKTLVMVFNCLKTLHLHFYFQGKEIEITPTYIYLVIKFCRARFSMSLIMRPWVNKGLSS